MTRTPLAYNLSFATPAFVGDAAQQAQWRTPPIKALIRQWWRMVKAPQVHFNIDGLRTREDTLFGSASDETKQPPAKAGGFMLRTESPDTRRLNDAS